MFNKKSPWPLLFLIAFASLANEIDQEIINNLDFYMNMEMMDSEFIDEQEDVTDEQFNANLEALND